MKQAVLLLAHGTPDTPDGVPEFLRNVTGGRTVPDAVIADIKHRYSLIGHSPLTDITWRQAQALARRLDVSVYVGMRNWHPFVVDAVNQMVEDGVGSAVAICLAPQSSRTSVGLYKRALFGMPGDEHSAPPPFPIAFIESWHDHPLLVRAFAERLTSAWTAACQETGAAVPIVFTAHSVPTRTIVEGDPYEAQARETAELVAAQVPRLNRGGWHFAFQSQGASGGDWVGPTVEQTISGLQRAGHRGVFIHPVGFVSDHVEVLYDIDIAFCKFAEERNMRLWRAPSLNDSPIFISALAELARVHLDAAAKMRSTLVRDEQSSSNA
jgi:protoporphyrin/coproporphyrin ferrochelatase